MRPTRQSPTDNANETEVTNIAAGAGATLQLVEARKVISLVRLEPVERDEIQTQRIPRASKANVGSNIKHSPRRLAVQSIDERCIR